MLRGQVWQWLRSGPKSNQKGTDRGDDGPGRRSAYCSPVRPSKVFHNAASIRIIGGRTQYFRFIANQNASWRRLLAPSKPLAHIRTDDGAKMVRHANDQNGSSTPRSR